MRKGERKSVGGVVFGDQNKDPRISSVNFMSDHIRYGPGGEGGRHTGALGKKRKHYGWGGGFTTRINSHKSLC